MSKYLSLFSLCDPRRQQSSLSIFWSELGNFLVSQNPREFCACLVLQDRFLVVHLPFCGMANLIFFAQFPVYRLPYPIESNLKLFLCSFATFAYSQINGFVSLSPLVIQLCIIDFGFNMIGPYSIVFCVYLKRVSFSHKVSFIIIIIIK